MYSVQRMQDAEEKGKHLLGPFVYDTVQKMTWTVLWIVREHQEPGKEWGLRNGFGVEPLCSNQGPANVMHDNNGIEPLTSGLHWPQNNFYINLFLEVAVRQRPITVVSTSNVNGKCLPQLQRHLTLFVNGIKQVYCENE